MVVGFKLSQQLATSSLIFKVFFEKTSEAFALPETNQEFSLVPSNLLRLLSNFNHRLFFAAL
jgi:hypothetical protein